LNQHLAWVIETLESAFLPLVCGCLVCADGTLTIKIFEKESGRVDLTVVGISLSRVQSIRDLLALVTELREELLLVNHDAGRVSGASF
jgi:hypothetical protein